MTDFSDDEILAFLACAAIAAFGAFRWFVPLMRITLIGGSSRQRLVLAATPLVCLALLLPALLHAAAHEVKEDYGYVALFECGGAAWLALTGLAISTLGILPREDAVERHNPAAVIAVCGALLGSTFCFLGANIGEGPTIWDTFGPAVLASAALWLLWFIVESASDFAETITIDRDVASGIRLAAFLIASGIVLGRAVAGDWESIERTGTDFIHQAWPAVVLAGATILAQRLSRPTPDNATPASAGALPFAAACVLGACAYVAVLGSWNHAILK